jgi:hypothetical protein
MIRGQPYARGASMSDAERVIERLIVALAAQVDPGKVG